MFLVILNINVKQSNNNKRNNEVSSPVGRRGALDGGKSIEK